MDDEVRTVGIGQQDGCEDLLAGDGRDGMALGGADAPVFGVRERAGAGAGGVGFDLVALFVVCGDDGLDFGEVDFQGDDASPGELDGLVSWG